jgi:hypothetical protein
MAQDIGGSEIMVCPFSADHVVDAARYADLAQN